ncbi:MAG: glycosyltransferase [Bacteroidales bacterium]|nr:glycosyltransferase [Bacteroidales bacterium]
MKILQINQNYNFGSTGRIMKEINDSIVNSGNEGFMLVAYANGMDAHLYVMESLPTEWAIKKNLIINRLTGLTGYKAKRRTRKAIKWIESVKPDIIHLHNIHGDWIHLESLFDYIRKNNTPVVWTLHDCWSFTGRCSHFDNLQCFRWLIKCKKCPDLAVYPKSYFFDFSEKMYADKKKWFSGLSCATIVTPSKWLADYVKQSFLGNYEVQVINNGIDLTQFDRKQTRSKYLGNDGRKVVLGVAASWTQRKGFDDIIKLHMILDPNQYVIVVVGLNAKQYDSLPEGIIGVKRTKNVMELAELYSQASVFVNPTYQDNYPTVNLEAIACGTPVITYETGGSVESITPETGIVVKKGDINAMADAILKVCEASVDYSEQCISYAQHHFDKNDHYQEYISLYEGDIR